MNFDQATDRVLGIEGRYVNNPEDPGGETNWGITWPKLNEAIGMGLLPAGTAIKDLTRDQAKVVYKALFWDRGHMDEYNGALAYQTYDAAVNHGIGNAVRFLQRAVGVADDGNIGPITIAAVKAMPASLCPAQITFIGCCGRGLSLQSSILKNSPLKLDVPVSSSSRITWTYSAAKS